MPIKNAEARKDHRENASAGIEMMVKISGTEYSNMVLKPKRVDRAILLEQEILA